MIERNKPKSYMLNAPNFNNEEDILEKFEEYLSYLERNPVMEQKAFGDKGGTHFLENMRVPSFEGFCKYTRCTKNYMYEYAKKYHNVFDFMDTCIHAIAYEGAAAGVIKESIVIRKLGLADKVEIKKTERKVIEFSMPDNGRVQEADYDLLD